MWNIAIWQWWGNEEKTRFHSDDEDDKWRKSGAIKQIEKVDPSSLFDAACSRLSLIIMIIKRGWWDDYGYDKFMKVFYMLNKLGMTLISITVLVLPGLLHKRIGGSL